MPRSTESHRTATPPPVELSSFIGRSSELAEVRALLATSRLLTLTGAGGSGKTRLALEAVRRDVAGHGDPAPQVVWVELAGLEDPGLLASHVAEGLGVAEELKGDDADALVPMLRGRPTLLVLDNCEHLVDACAGVVDTLLRACPDLRVLATSREALGVPGERAWLVPPLSLPDEGDPSASEAVRLFVERAREAVPGFDLTPGNAEAVAEVCRRLDGIPLAIELAAARVRILSPGQIRERLGDAFGILASGARTAIPRHRTLRAAIDWSHDLLRPGSRALLRRLSVFRGGFDLEAAEAVGEGDDLEPEGVLELLASLVDRSMVVVRERDGVTRYGLLETVRQYAALRLEESGEGDSTRRRHAVHYAALARRAEPHFRGPERPAWLGLMEREVDNLREALAWTRDHDGVAHVRLVGDLWWFWYSTRHWLEAGRWTNEALGRPEAAAPGPARAALLFAAGALACLQARATEARALLSEAAALAEGAGAGSLEAYALNYLGMAWAQDGDQRGTEVCERAAALCASAGDDYGLRMAKVLLGSLASARGDLAQALALNREGVDIARRASHDRELAIALLCLAEVHLRLDEVDAASALLIEALQSLRRDPSSFVFGLALDFMADALARQGRSLDAARCVGAADGFRELIGATRFDIHERRVAEVVVRIAEVVGEEGIAAARAEGRDLVPDGILDCILASEGGTTDDGDLREAAEAGREEDRPSSGGGGTPPSSAVDLRVRALGPVVVEVGGCAIPHEAWPYAKPRELLVYLLLHPQGRTRGEIGDALWPASGTSQVKNSFHVTLHHLRKVLQRPEWVVFEGDRYRLAGSVTRAVDVEEFENDARALLADPHAPEEALRDLLGRHRDVFMEDEPGADWIDDVRARILALRGELRMRLGSLLQASGRFDEAARAYAEVVARDDLHEEAHRRVMACLASSGERERALRHFERLADTLRTEFLSEPEAATVELYRQLAG